MVSAVTGRPGGASARYLLRAGPCVKGRPHPPSNVPHIQLRGVEPILGDLREPSTHPTSQGGGRVPPRDGFPRPSPGDGRSPRVGRGRASSTVGGGPGGAGRRGVEHPRDSVSLSAQRNGRPFHAATALFESVARSLGLPNSVTRPPYFGDVWRSPKRGGLTGRQGRWPDRGRVPRSGSRDPVPLRVSADRSRHPRAPSEASVLAPFGARWAHGPPGPAGDRDGPDQRYFWSRGQYQRVYWAIQLAGCPQVGQTGAAMGGAIGGGGVMPGGAIAPA